MKFVGLGIEKLEPEQDTEMHFCSCDLDHDQNDLNFLTYEIDLAILQMYLHTKNEVFQSRLSKIGAQTGQTDTRQTDMIGCFNMQHSWVVKTAYSSVEMHRSMLCHMLRADAAGCGWFWGEYCLLLEGNNEPDSLLILAEEELVAVDLVTPGWPLYRLPYINSIHASSIVSASHINNVPRTLWQRISIAGCSQHTNFSPRVCFDFCCHSLHCSLCALRIWQALDMWLCDYDCDKVMMAFELADVGFPWIIGSVQNSIIWPKFCSVAAESLTLHVFCVHI